jgi:glutathione S-transferase
MIECFCVPTANGQKATILLEELELDYEITPVDLRKGEHLTDGIRHAGDRRLSV